MEFELSSLTSTLQCMGYVLYRALVGRAILLSALNYAKVLYHSASRCLKKLLTKCPQGGYMCCEGN